MPFDEVAAEALVADVAQSFRERLQGLVAAAAADLESERQSVEEQAHNLAARAARLAEESERLARERAAFERERAMFGKVAGQDEEEEEKRMPELVSLNLGGEAQTTVLRTTLTQCEDSMLAAAFSGRWELPKDEAGNIFVDFEPALFLPLVQYLRMRRIEGPEDPSAPPNFGGDVDLEARFQRMLRYYGLESWVYRDVAPDGLQYHVHIDDHTYTVLPPMDPEETVAFGDMSCQVVTVPKGWEVLQTDAEHFQEIIRELANHSWGALRLCCQNQGCGFSSYLTRLHGGGTAGTRWSGDAKLLQPVGGSECRQFRFATACSARLVIRVRDQPLGGGSPVFGRGGEGRRLTAI